MTNISVYHMKAPNLKTIALYKSYNSANSTKNNLILVNNLISTIDKFHINAIINKFINISYSSNVISAPNVDAELFFMKKKFSNFKYLVTNSILPFSVKPDILRSLLLVPLIIA